MPVSTNVRRAALVFALTAAVYAPFVLEAGWLWDDDDYVTDNPALVAPGGLRAIWLDASATPQFYPLTHTTFWAEVRLFGLRPGAFRAVNVMLHGIAAALLGTILARLRVPGAWLAAIVFAVHPIQVESVAWITERKNVLCGALYLASLLCWVRAFALDGHRAERSRPFPVGFAVAGFALYALALFAKTVATTLPVTLAVLLWWRGSRPTRREAGYLGAMLACGLLLGSLTAVLETQQIGAQGSEWAWTAVDRVRLAGRAWWFYLGKVAWPAELAFVYPRWEPSSWGPTAWAWPAAAATTLAALVGAAGRIGRGPAAAMLHYTVAVAPALGFANVYPMRYTFVADHFAYLAVIGPIALGAAALASAARGRLPTAAVRAFAVALAIALVVPAWNRVPAFSGAEALWRETVRRNPRAWIAHAHLGILDAERGDLAAARTRFERVLEIHPPGSGARNNLGVVLAREGRVREAREVLEDAVVRDAEDANAWRHLADARVATGDPAGAERAWRALAALRPGDPEARIRAIASMIERGSPVEAAGVAEVALRGFPTVSRLHHLAGLARVAAGDAAGAESALRRAAVLDPGSADVRYHLGNVLASEGRYDEAVTAYREALRMAPDHAGARRNLAEAGRRAASAADPL